MQMLFLTLRHKKSPTFTSQGPNLIKIKCYTDLQMMLQSYEEKLKHGEKSHQSYKNIPKVG